MGGLDLRFVSIMASMVTFIHMLRVPFGLALGLLLVNEIHSLRLKEFVNLGPS
jgi:hypothetical protein